MSLMFFTMSLAFYFLATAFYIGYWLTRKDWMGQAGTSLTYVAGFSMTMILIFRAVESGHAPFSNLYESMVLFIWAVTIGYLWMERKYKFKVLGAFVMTVASLAMVSAWLLPFRFKNIEPLNPALQSKWNFLVKILEPLGLEKYAIGWLDFHVFATFIGYAAFAISFAVAIMYIIKIRYEARSKKSFLFDSFPPSKVLDELSYITIAWGFPFLTVGIVTGAIWANYAWGTYWSWDPKETWSLITWLVYAAYLHARVTRGWRGKKAAYISIAGFLAVIFLYWGVSFILPGLHAYA
ncbi:MAG: c-type cytochrome biogenesis protein CcsB [Deltaproteobacteria bacterium]|nr:c-type cytochrome biogenesis protein CcsB [Deltaproteobacteria bacterium]